MKHLQGLSPIEQMQYIFEQCGKTDKEAFETVEKIEKKTGVKESGLKWWLKCKSEKRIPLDNEIIDAYRDFVSKHGSKPRTYAKETGIRKYIFMTILTPKCPRTLRESEYNALKKFLEKRGYNLSKKEK